MPGGGTACTDDVSSQRTRPRKGALPGETLTPMTTFLRLRLTGLLLLALGLVACGGSGGDPNGGDAPAAPTEATPTDTAPTDAPPDDGGSAGDDNGGFGVPGAIHGDGTLVIDGETYNVETVLRCEPFDDGEDSLDLAALASGATVFVYLEEYMGSVLFEVGLQGPMGLYENLYSEGVDGWVDDRGDPVDGLLFEIDGNRIRGASTLIEFHEGEDTLELSYDLPIPDTIVDC
jgi:hypothetical protein